MNKIRKEGKQQIFCWIFAIVMLLTGVRVQASVFEAPILDGSFSGEEFSSGEDAVFSESDDTGSGSPAESQRRHLPGADP